MDDSIGNITSDDSNDITEQCNCIECQNYWSIIYSNSQTYDSDCDCSICDDFRRLQFNGPPH